MHRDKLVSHIKHLEEKHRSVDENINHMEATGHYNDDEIHALKKYRLSLKDEIASTQRLVDGLAQ